MEQLSRRFLDIPATKPLTSLAKITMNQLAVIGERNPYANKDLLLQTLLKVGLGSSEELAQWNEADKAYKTRLVQLERQQQTQTGSSSSSSAPISSVLAAAQNAAVRAAQAANIATRSASQVSNSVRSTRQSGVRFNEKVTVVTPSIVAPTSVEVGQGLSEQEIEERLQEEQKKSTTDIAQKQLFGLGARSVVSRLSPETTRLLQTFSPTADFPRGSSEERQRAVQARLVEEQLPVNIDVQASQRIERGQRTSTLLGIKSLLEKPETLDEQVRDDFLRRLLPGGRGLSRREQQYLIATSRYAAAYSKVLEEIAANPSVVFAVPSYREYMKRLIDAEISYA